MQRPSRRALLAAAGTAAVSLAGCASDGTDSPPGGDTDQTTPKTEADTGEPTADPRTTAAETTAAKTTAGSNDTEPVWYTEQLTDARTGETFTIAELNADGPVLLETFAIWCSNCQRQQVELQTFHEQAPDDVTTVALDVDPNEDRSAVADHAEENDFDWRYAVSPPAVTQSLIGEFGRSITVPPQVPMVRICPGGETTRLPDGHKPTDDLLSALDSCE